MIEYIDFKSVEKTGLEQCQRLFHGRGKAYPGWEHVTVDWLPPVVLITLYAEESSERLNQMASDLRACLPGCSSIQVKYRCRSKSPYEVLWGENIQELEILENDLKYQIQLGRSQNIGFFLDMRNGRQWVRDNAKDKRVLNLFSYTCAFSVVALAGGATFVLNVDMAKSALSRGRDNHRLNQQDLKKVRFEGVDIFKSFSRLKKHGPYDMLICDPPQFQKGSVDIKRDYKKIIRRLPQFLNPGARLMLCLNSPELSETFIHEMVAESCSGCTYVNAISTPDVYKETQAGRGLKVLIFEYPGD